MGLFFVTMYQNFEASLLNTTDLIHADCTMYVLTLCEELNTVDSPMFYFTYFLNTEIYLCFTSFAFV